MSAAERLRPISGEAELRDLLADVRPATLEEFILYVSMFYGARLATKACCPEHTAPGQVWWELFNDEVMDAIIVGSRDTGKTFGFAFLDHMQMRFNGDEIANIGAIEAQAKKCYGYIQRFVTSKVFRKDLLKPPMISMTLLKNGGKVEVMPATINKVNSPHPRICNVDEIELVSTLIVNEILSVPSRMNGRPPAIRYTSSRKRAYGTLENLIAEKDDRGLKLYIWCVFCVMKTCPVERHQGGKGCRGDATTPACPLMEDCLISQTNAQGEQVYRDGPGRAAFVDGHFEVDDVIRQKRLMDKDVWNSQWLSRRASAKGLVYPDFAPDRHIIRREDYDWNPSLPVFVGQDFGYANPGAVLFAQMLPTEELIVFAEIYEQGWVTSNWIRAIKDTPWAKNIAWIAADPAAADARHTESNAGLPVVAANNEVEDGLARVRWLLDPPGRDLPMLYISERCTNLVRELKSYHFKPPAQERNLDEEPEKMQDHAADALRYLVAQLYGGKIAV